MDRIRDKTRNIRGDRLAAVVHRSDVGAEMSIPTSHEHHGARFDVAIRPVDRYCYNTMAYLC
jgi:hypothetical protein